MAKEVTICVGVFDDAVAAVLHHQEIDDVRQIVAELAPHRADAELVPVDYHLSGRPRTDNVRGAATGRSLQRALKEAGDGARTRLCARERHVGKLGILPGLRRSGADDPTERFSERTDPRRMEGRRRFRAGREQNTWECRCSTALLVDGRLVGPRLWALTLEAASLYGAQSPIRPSVNRLVGDRPALSDARTDPLLQSRSC